MAERTAMVRSAERISANLRLLAEEFAELPDIAQEWENEVAVAGFEMAWWDYMTRFRGLHEAYQTKGMTPEQAKQYRALVQLFRKHRPVVRRLRLPEPPFPLEKVARAE